jgi:hypothetical protein
MIIISLVFSQPKLSFLSSKYPLCLLRIKYLFFLRFLYFFVAVLISLCGFLVIDSQALPVPKNVQLFMLYVR